MARARLEGGGVALVCRSPLDCRTERWEGVLRYERAVVLGRSVVVWAGPRCCSWLT